jgi:hypothetical protein
VVEAHASDTKFPHPDYPPGWFSDLRYIACEPSPLLLVEGPGVNFQHSEGD